jgi:hypothetical protein
MWALSVAPSGNVIFLMHHLNGSSILRMLSPTNLREIRSWEESEAIVWASDEYFAKMGTDNILYARAFDTPWRAIAELGRRGSDWMRAEARFINEDSLVVGGCDPVQLVRVDGRVLLKARLPKDHPAGYAWGSPDGRFIAVQALRMTGATIEALDMYRHPTPWRTLVYDTKSGNAVCAMRFTRRSACAFSPDSSSLATLKDGIIELFSLPPSDR